MEFHEAANIFPLLEGKEFNELVKDIEQNGLMQPILVDAKTQTIIDGRNRYRACQVAMVKPVFDWWEGDDPVSFVVSLNLHRRHLNESQRAMVAAKIANLEKGDNQHTQICGTSQAQAAEQLQVSERSVSAAKRTVDRGTPELVQAVERGEVAVSTAAVITELPKEEQAEVIAKGEKEILAKAKEIRQAKTDQRRAERIERVQIATHEPTPLEQLNKRYPVIYADPPWQYDFAKDSADEIEEHYPTMSITEICALPVSDICTNDAVLFLWTTSPKLPEAFKVLDWWGFTYRTCQIWDKEWIGPGYYFRQQHEILIVATKGNLPVPEPSNRFPSVYRERRTEHSKKPQKYYEFIDAMYPELPKIELFSRNTREGWDVWGNQV